MWARRIGGRRPVMAMGALAAAVAFASTAPADHSLVELASIGPAGGNGASDVSIDGASADAARVFVSTRESLVAADTDASSDIYERFNGQTTLLSIGPAGGNGVPDPGFVGASKDGTRVFFETAESLVATDTDGVIDVYERFDNQTTLLSIGPAGGNGSFGAGFGGISEDGTHVVFATAESLVSGDTDGVTDLYERFNGATTLVSTGPGGNTTFTPSFEEVSADGSRVFFTTSEQLATGDTDGAEDVYERFNGQTTRLSLGAAGGNGATNAFFAGASDDGTVVFISTRESLESGDLDSEVDFYEHSASTTELLSIGPTGGNAATPAFFFVDGHSADGSRFFFETFEQLVAQDTDSSPDTYERFNGTTTLISTGPTGGNSGALAPLAGLSDDGQRVFFYTGERLVAADTDTGLDIYERFNGQTTLVSAGPAAGQEENAFFEGASADGTRVFFSTLEQVLPGDTDGAVDVYERFDGQTTLVSVGPAGGNGNFGAGVGGISEDGTRVVFDTSESLVSADTDANFDVYVSRVAPAPPRPEPPSGSGAGGGGSPTDAPGEVAPVFTDAVAAQTIEGDRDGDGIPDSQDESDASAGPVLGESVVARVVSGEVFVRRTGGSPRSAGRAAQAPGTPVGFVPVKGAEVVPVGSVVQTLRGRVALTSVAQVVAGRSQTQRGEFYAGVFQIRQARARRPVTELVLRGSYPQICGSAARAGGGPDAAASQRRTSRRVSRLWGDGRGRFRTKGRYSSATVRGTVWLTENRCDGTLTRVRQGRVTVRDFTAGRTVTVRAGGSYLARAQRSAIRRR